MRIDTTDDARRFVENVYNMYPLDGDPEFTFVSWRSGQPVAFQITVDPDGSWYKWRKVLGPAGGAYDSHRIRIIDPVDFVYRYRVDIARALSMPVVIDVPESMWGPLPG